MPFASETPRATHRVLFAGGIKSPENPSSGSRETLQYGVLQRLSLPKPFPKQKPVFNPPSASPLNSKKGTPDGLGAKRSGSVSGACRMRNRLFSLRGGPGGIMPPGQGVKGSGSHPCRRRHYFFRFSASSSAMCVTLRPLPSFSAPPRIWSTQPGQSMTTRDAPVSAMPSSFLRSSAAETSGNLAE